MRSGFVAFAGTGTAAFARMSLRSTTLRALLGREVSQRERGARGARGCSQLCVHGVVWCGVVVRWGKRATETRGGVGERRGHVTVRAVSGWQQRVARDGGDGANHGRRRRSAVPVLRAPPPNTRSLAQQHTPVLLPTAAPALTPLQLLPAQPLRSPLPVPVPLSPPRTPSPHRCRTHTRTRTRNRTRPPLRRHHSPPPPLHRRRPHRRRTPLRQRKAVLPHPKAPRRTRPPRGGTQALAPAQGPPRLSPSKK